MCAIFADDVGEPQQGAGIDGVRPSAEYVIVFAWQADGRATSERRLLEVVESPISPNGSGALTWALSGGSKNLPRGNAVHCVVTRNRRRNVQVLFR